MASERCIRVFLSEIEAEFVALLRDKYCDYPNICGLASHMLLAYMSTRLNLGEATVHDGEHDSRLDGDIIGSSIHAWIRVGNLLVDPTYEQYSSAHFGRFRVVAASEVVGYESHTTTAVGRRHLERAQNALTHKEFVGQYECRRRNWIPRPGGIHQAITTMNSNESVKLRVDMIDGMFQLDDATKDFMTRVRTEVAALAARLAATAPATCDVGRFIAATDHLQQAKNLYCDAAILGREAANRREKTQ
jgi:hypothetical protein